MTGKNPYEAPRARVEGALETSEGVEKLASGQKLVIYAILLNLAALALQVAVGPLGGLLGIAGLVLSLIGVVRLGVGFGLSVFLRIVLCILMFVPLLNLIALLVMNSRATARLREAGYKVGLLGASR